MKSCSFICVCMFGCLLDVMTNIKDINAKECEIGFYGLQPLCKKCPYPTHGDKCQALCKCNKDICNHATGCSKFLLDTVDWITMGDTGAERVRPIHLSSKETSQNSSLDNLFKSSTSKKDSTLKRAVSLSGRIMAN